MNQDKKIFAVFESDHPRIVFANLVLETPITATAIGSAANQPNLFTFEMLKQKKSDHNLSLAADIFSPEDLRKLEAELPRLSAAAEPSLRE